MNTLKNITNIHDIEHIPAIDLLKYEEVQQLLLFSPGTKAKIMNDRFIFVYNKEVKLVVDEQEYYIAIKLTRQVGEKVASIDVFKDLSFLNKNIYSIDSVLSVTFYDDDIDNYESYKEHIKSVIDTPWYNYICNINTFTHIPYTLLDDVSIEYALITMKTRYVSAYRDYLKIYVEGVSTLDLGSNRPLWQQLDLVWPLQARIDAIKYTLIEDNYKFYIKSYAESKGDVEVYYMSLGYDNVLYRVEFETIRSDVFANNVKYFTSSKRVVNKVDSIYCSNRKAFMFLTYLLGFVPYGNFASEVNPLDLLKISVGFYNFYHIETFERDKPLLNELKAEEVNELLNRINIKLDPLCPHYLNMAHNLENMGIGYGNFVENAKHYTNFIYHKVTSDKNGKGLFGWMYV